MDLSLYRTRNRSAHTMRRYNAAIDHDIHASNRFIIDTTKGHKLSPQYRHLRRNYPSNLQLLEIHTRKRAQRIGSILALGEIIRENANTTINKVSPHKAIWQQTQASGSYQAAHTSPCQLLFNEVSPTSVVDSQALQRAIVWNFAEVVPMPTNVNRLDKLMDHSLQLSEIFANRVHEVLTTDTDYVTVFESFAQDTVQLANSISISPADYEKYVMAILAPETIAERNEWSKDDLKKAKNYEENNDVVIVKPDVIVGYYERAFQEIGSYLSHINREAEIIADEIAQSSA